MAELGFVRLRTFIIVYWSLRGIGSQEWSYVLIPVDPALWSCEGLLLCMVARRLFGCYIFLDQISKFTRTQLCLFVVVVIVPFFQFLEVGQLQLLFHDRCNFEQKVKLLNQVFSILVFGFVSIVKHDIVQPSVYRIVK